MSFGPFLKIISCNSCRDSYINKFIKQLSHHMNNLTNIKMTKQDRFKTLQASVHFHMNKQGRQYVATCKPVTTFVQTDTNAFREIVQRLTGPSENNNAVAVAVPEATVIKHARKKKPTSKLHERRQCMRQKLEVVKPPLSFKPTGTTPSSKSGIITTPSSLFSDLYLTEGDKADIDQEDKAIKERRFYLHPSPRSKPGYTEPELLALFPLTSPNSSGRP